MRLSELLEKDVFDVDGKRLGHVHDVRLVQDGPVLGEWGAAFRVHELAVGHRSIGTRLGYGRADMKGPWLLKLIFRHTPRMIPWTAVRAVEDERIVVDARQIDGS